MAKSIPDIPTSFEGDNDTTEGELAVLSTVDSNSRKLCNATCENAMSLDAPFLVLTFLFTFAYFYLQR